MLKLNLALFISTAAMLFYIVRYRIHLHVEYSPLRSRRHARRARFQGPATEPGRVAPVDSGEASGVARDLESALVNLGASKEEARQRTACAIAQGPGDFDALILRAMQAGGEPSARRNPRRSR
jgi:hypothetical protein